MGRVGHFAQRTYQRWKQDTLSQSDFRPSVSILKLSLMAVFVGIAAAFVALVLYKMISLVTNLAFRQQLSFDFMVPALHASVWAILLAPLVGGLLVGLMARYGTERIRGHGIPEALEAILFRKSKMMLKVAILKPLSAAIAIGTGGPFGAEGPIIMTGGAVGSLFGQMFYLTSMERRTLLVAGACAGMAATFGTPIAATRLAVELLLFELRPRSTIPVAIACFAADVLRSSLMGPGALFPLTAQFDLTLSVFGMAVVCGFLAGLLATLLALGAGLGGLESMVFPGPDPLLWPLLGMGAMLAGVMRLPFTAILFALELTHNASALPALLIACTTAYGVSVFLMKRSILTEKIARRGLDIFREYSVDRLEHIAVKEVMTTDMMTVPGDLSVRELAERYFGADQKYRAFPVVDANGGLLNVVNRQDVAQWLKDDPSGASRLADVVGREPVIALPDESCQSVAVRAAVEKLDRVPVVAADRRTLLGMVTRYDLLKPYTHYHSEEKVRERFFRNSKPSGLTD